MGDKNQLDWVSKHRGRVAGPIPEVGSLHYAKESSSDFRALFSFSRNPSATVEPGEDLDFSVPFAWRFHGYPSDYGRFSPEAIKFLFPEIDFIPADGMLSSNVLGDCRPLTDNPTEVRVKPIRP